MRIRKWVNIIKFAIFLLAWWQQWETPSQHVSSKYYWSTVMTANTFNISLLLTLVHEFVNVPVVWSICWCLESSCFLLSLTERVLAGADGLVRETISWMARRSLSLCRGLLMPISLWISVSDRLAIIAPLFTLARHAATYHAGIPTHSWTNRKKMWAATLVMMMKWLSPDTLVSIISYYPYTELNWSYSLTGQCVILYLEPCNNSWAIPWGERQTLTTGFL